MIKAFVNGEYRELAEGATVTSIVRELAASEDGVAVAVDGEGGPRGDWARRELRAGGEVGVVRAGQGGALDRAGRWRASSSASPPRRR